MEPGDHVISVAERLARFQRSRDVRDLWPGIPPAAVTRARGDIGRVVRQALAADVAPALSAQTVPSIQLPRDSDARAFSVAAYSMGMGALLAYWAREGRLLVSDPLRHLLREQLDHLDRFARRMEREIEPVLDAMHSRDLMPVVIKGAHTARRYWPIAGVRPLADIDLVVPPDRTDDAEWALSSCGFRATTPRTEHPYKRHWSPPNDPSVPFSLERPDARNAWRVDLHDSFDCEYRDVVYARLDSERGRLASFALGGRAVLAPAQPLTLLLLACHVGSEWHSMRLFRIVELVQVIRQDSITGELDWDALRRVCHENELARFVHPAFALVEQLAPGTIDARVAEQLRAGSTWIVRRVTRRLRPEGGEPHKDFITTFMWAASAKDLLRALLRRLFRRDDRGRLARWMTLLRHMRAGGIRLSGDEVGNGSRGVDRVGAFDEQ